MTCERWMPGIAAVVVVAGCSSMPPPVHVIGNPTDVAQLAGRWTGEYLGETSQRSGTIVFTLQASSDTAFGEVLMIPKRHERGRTLDETRIHEDSTPRAPPITFVFVSGERVTGLLDPYDDPDSGQTLVTRFWGHVESNVMSGAYESINVGTGEVTYGEWKVNRSPAHAVPDS